MKFTVYHILLAVEALRAIGEVPNFSGLTMSGVDLANADLHGAILAGGFWGTVDEFRTIVLAEKGENHPDLAAVELLTAVLK